MSRNEEEAVLLALRDGWLEGDGTFSNAAASRLGNILGIGRALLTTAGTHALELAFHTI